MTVCPIYDHRDLYIQKMKDFVTGKIDGTKFSNWFLSQRSDDLDEGKKIANSSPLTEAEQAILDKAKSDFHTGNISREEWFDIADKIIYTNLFLKLFDELQAVDIEDFWPRDDPDFEEDVNIDEEELRRRVKAKLDTLEQNKGKW